MIVSRPGRKVPGQSPAVRGKERRARKAKHAERNSDERNRVSCKPHQIRTRETMYSHAVKATAEKEKARAWNSPLHAHHARIHKSRSRTPPSPSHPPFNPYPPPLLPILLVSLLPSLQFFSAGHTADDNAACKGEGCGGGSGCMGLGMISRGKARGQRSCAASLRVGL